MKKPRVQSSCSGVLVNNKIIILIFLFLIHAPCCSKRWTDNLIKMDNVKTYCMLVVSSYCLQGLACFIAGCLWFILLGDLTIWGFVSRWVCGGQIPLWNYIMKWNRTRLDCMSSYKYMTLYTCIQIKQLVKQYPPPQTFSLQTSPESTKIKRHAL